MIPRLTALSRALLFTSFSSTNSTAKMAVQDFVNDSIANNKVVIFSKTWCPYCQNVKELFSDKFPDLKYHVIELNDRDDGSSIQEYLLKQTGQRTVPSVFVNQQHIGGSDDTTAAYNSGQLSKLLGE